MPPSGKSMPPFLSGKGYVMAKIIKPLSPMQVKNARPQEKIYRLFDGGGLYLEVTPQGSKLWRMKFRQPNGKENRLSFGKYPDVSLEQARQKRDEARKLKAAGVDAAENRKFYSVDGSVCED